MVLVFDIVSLLHDTSSYCVLQLYEVSFKKALMVFNLQHRQTIALQIIKEK